MSGDAEIEQVVTWRRAFDCNSDRFHGKSRSRRGGRNVHTEEDLGADRWVARPGAVELPPPGLRVWRKGLDVAGWLGARMPLMTSLRRFEQARTTPQSQQSSPMSPRPRHAVASRIVESWWGRPLRPSEDPTSFNAHRGCPDSTQERQRCGVGPPDRTKEFPQSPF